MRNFLLEQYPNIDVNPIGQRLDVEEKDKDVGIINSVLDGIFIGAIQINESDEISRNGFKKESLDGGHRKRTFRRFIDNNVKSKYGYFKDLTEEQKTKFYNYQLIIIKYKNLTNKQKADVFKNTNQSTPVNHQENRNAEGDTDIACFIRNTARGVEGIIHPLFCPSNKFFESADKRLDYDEKLTGIVYRHTQEKLLGTHSQDDYNKLFENQTISTKVKKDVKECLDWITNVASARKANKLYSTGLSNRMFWLLFRFYSYVKDNHGDFKVKDFAEFNTMICSAENEYLKKDSKYRDIFEKTGDQDRSRSTAFQGYLTTHLADYKIQKSLEWLFDEFDYQSYITILDKKRCFPKKWKEQRLIETNGKCESCDKEIGIDECIGGHDTPHSDGGRTTYENFKALCTECNQQMGTLTFSQYKELKNA